MKPQPRHTGNRSLVAFLLSIYVAVAPCAQRANAGNYDFSLYPAHPSAPQGANPGASFQTDEFTGAFGYNIQIQLPPARPGAMPSVALSYASGGTNGWLGVGWSLDVGYIERDGRKGVPIKWNTSTLPALPQAPLQYDDTHGFMFSFRGKSSRLVLVNEVTGEYRSEIDTEALKFILSPTGWTVYDKSGGVHQFGVLADSANSRMDIPATDTTATGNLKTFRWALSSSQDPNNNRIAYEYTAPIAPHNQIYLDRIRYNGHYPEAPSTYTHVVEFVLEDRLDGLFLERDVPLSYRSGYRVETKKRLKSITTKVSGVRARQYELQYTQSPSTGRSLLSRVLTYGKFGTGREHNPIVLTYQTQSLSFAPATTWGDSTGRLLHQPLGTQVPTNGLRPWNAIGWRTNGYNNPLGAKTMLELMDIDRDGLPDRVLTDQDYDVGVPNPNNPPNMYLVQHNTRAAPGFDDQLDSYSFTPWLNQGGPAAMRGSLGWTGTNGCDLNAAGKTYLKLIDVNGDGYADRVHDWRRFHSTPTVAQLLSFYVEYGSGTNFGPLTPWGPIENHDNPHASQADDELYGYTPWNSPEYAFQDCHMSGGPNCTYTTGTCLPEHSVGALVATLLDVNGDGLPDRVVRLSNNVLTPRDHFRVQLNTLNSQGQATFGPLLKWEFENQYVADQYYWNNPFTFESLTNLNSNTPVGLFDMNGDGLPDRVMRKAGSCSGNPASYFDSYVVQYNKGFEFEEGQPPTYFGPLQMPANFTGANGCSYASPSSSEDSLIAGGNEGNFNIAMLQDVNGDGLVDRLVHDVTGTQGSWSTATWVQLNEGSKFGYAQPISGLQVFMQICNPQYPGAWHYPQASMAWPYPCEGIFVYEPGSMEYGQMRDMNGDGLVDRVMASPVPTNDSGLQVQLAEGDFPDLLKRVENGLGGKISVEYKPSTEWVNRHINVPSGQTPWEINAKSLLGSVIQTVSKVTVEDGIHAPAFTTYEYAGGMYDYEDKEFRGFHKTTKRDPSNAYTVTYFHQDGGMDGSLLGEYADNSINFPSYSKRGMPFRIESRDSDNYIYQVVIHKVDEMQLTPGVKRWFPYVAQTATMSFEKDASPRTAVEIYQYELPGAFETNLSRHTQLGEVTQFNPGTHDVAGNVTTLDDLVAERTYVAVAGNAELRDRVNFEYWKNSAGAILRQRDHDYLPTTGNRNVTRTWRDLPTPLWLTESFTYDSYGNLEEHMQPGPGTIANPTGAGASVTRRTTWDTAYHVFPAQVTDDYGTGTLNYTSTSTFDELSGLIETSTDWNGVTTRNVQDPLYHRVAAVWLDLPGSPSIWQQRFIYQFHGASAGVSANFIGRVVNDATSPEGIDGHHTRTYSDGFGRVIQARVESERGDGQGATYYRVAHTRFDARGNPARETRENFSLGTAFTALNLSDPFTQITYDPLGRPTSLVPPIGDAGSPTGEQTTEYKYLTDPWVRVLKDGKKNTPPNIGSERREHRDAFGRIWKIDEVVSPGTVYSTTYKYNLFGDLIEVVDNAQNKTSSTYDSLGRKLTTQDPDLGTIVTSYFDDGSVKAETYGNGNNTASLYDNLGRAVETRTFLNGVIPEQEKITYRFDANTDGTGALFPVFLGQLFKVTCEGPSGVQSFTRNGYNVRGHTIRKLTHVAKTGLDYTTTYTYDEVGRRITMAYPRSNAALRYTYDTAGNIKRVEATSGTGPTNEVFYDAQQFDELRQPERVAYGNGVTNYYTFYPGSKRLQSSRAQLGSNADYMNLAYTYDAAGNVLSITDGVALHTGLASGTRSNIQYDTLYRMTGYTRPVTGGAQSFAFAYNAIGNMVSNADFGGAYTYPSSGPSSVRPHAVSTATNGQSQTHAYSYDDSGNMRTRGPTGAQQVLSYNARNLLIGVTPATGPASTFGYDASGNRLWKQVGTGVTVWIDEHFEERNNKKLCHVIVDGRRVCTFQPMSIAGPQAMSQGPIQPLVFDYYHQDQIRSATVMTGRNGSLAQAYQYSAFGTELYVADPAAFKLLNRFTDQEWDADTGLYYYGARYYDPSIGRFIQADTLFPDVYNPQGLNRYSYVLNNPFRYIDPTGQSWWDILTNAAKGAVLGDFAGEDLGVAGLVGSVIGGLTPLGVLADLRDFAAAGTDIITGKGDLSSLGLATLGLIPGLSEVRKVSAAVGAAGDVAGEAIKHSDEVADVTKNLIKRADDVPGAGKAPDFVVTTGGDAIPIPKGATGPSPTEGEGFKYVDGRGGHGFSKNTTGVRIMDPIHKYPGGRVAYMNAKFQTIDPYTGRTVPKTHPAAHFPIENRPKP